VLIKPQCIVDFYHEFHKFFKIPFYILLCLAAKEPRPPVLVIGDIFLPQVGKSCPEGTLALRCVQNAVFLRRRKKTSLLTPDFHLVLFSVNSFFYAIRKNERMI